LIKAIVFDCFGVVRSDAVKEAYRSKGGDPERDQEFIKQALEVANDGILPPSISLIAARLGISSAEWFEALRVRSSTNMRLLGYVQGLRGTYKIAMLTNIRKGGLLGHFTPGFLKQYFDVTVESGDIGCAKPAPQAYEIVADKLGVRPHECVFIDDRQDYVEGAEKVGMKAIRYTTFATCKSQLEELL
jgi:FMN phosphatase YigB (HAD superfamily)